MLVDYDEDDVDAPWGTTRRAISEDVRVHMHFSGGPADPTHRLAAGWGTQLENTSELKVEAPFRLSCEGSYTLVSAFPPPFFPPPSPPPLWALHGVSSPSPLDSPLRRCRQGGTLQIAFPPLISPFSFPLGVRQPGGIFPSSLFSFLVPPWASGFGWISLDMGDSAVLCVPEAGSSLAFSRG